MARTAVPRSDVFPKLRGLSLHSFTTHSCCRLVSASVRLPWLRESEARTEADPSDPAAHCAMGLALWLRREHDNATGELGHSVRLSPSYALAHYRFRLCTAKLGILRVRLTQRRRRIA